MRWANGARARAGTSLEPLLSEEQQKDQNGALIATRSYACYRLRHRCWSCRWKEDRVTPSLVLSIAA